MMMMILTISLIQFVFFTQIVGVSAEEDDGIEYNEHCVCSQDCSKTEKDDCKCISGYMINSQLSKYRCVAEELDAKGYLLMSHDNQISRLSLDTYTLEKVIYKVEGSIPTSIDFNYDTNEIFWSDSADGVIWRAPIDNATPESKRKVFQYRNRNYENNSINHAMAIDWVHQNLYFAQSYYIFIIDIRKGGYRKIVFDKHSNNMDRIKGIAVDPIRSHLFWICSGKDGDKVVQGGLDGSRPETVIERTKRFTRSLAVDLTNQRFMFTTEAPLWNISTLFSSDYKGKDLKRVGFDLDGITEVDGIQYNNITSISTFEGIIYCLKSPVSLLMTAHNYGKKATIKVEPRIANVSVMHDIVVYHKLIQIRSENLCANFMCSHICTTVPNEQDSSGKKAVCLCPEGMQLDPSDGKTCTHNSPDSGRGSSSENKGINGVREFGLNTFELFNGACSIMDGVDFICNRNNSKTCVDHTFCNGVPDCPNGRDEDVDLCSLTNVNECDSEIPDCNDKCVDHDISYSCKCSLQNWELNSDGKSCTILPKCEKCSQLCNTNRNPTCDCVIGYYYNKKEPGFCVANDRISGFLLLALPKGISKLPFDEATRRASPEPTEILHKFDDDMTDTYIQCIDFHHQAGLIFWADRDNALWTNNINHDYVSKKIATFEREIRISVDWIYDRIYIADLHKNDILQTDLEGQSSVTLVRNRTNLQAIVVDPPRGVLFWSESLNFYGKIVKATLNATKERTIIDRNVPYPIALSLDQVMERIYWADHKLGHISSCNYDGNDRKILAHLPGVFFTDLTNFQGRIFAVAYNRIYDFPKMRGFSGYQKVFTSAITKESAITAITTYHRLRQPGLSKFNQVQSKTSTTDFVTPKPPVTVTTPKVTSDFVTSKPPVTVTTRKVKKTH